MQPKSQGERVEVPCCHCKGGSRWRAHARSEVRRAAPIPREFEVRATDFRRVYEDAPRAAGNVTIRQVLSIIRTVAAGSYSRLLS